MKPWIQMESTWALQRCFPVRNTKLPITLKSQWNLPGTSEPGASPIPIPDQRSEPGDLPTFQVLPPHSRCSPPHSRYSLLPPDQQSEWSGWLSITGVKHWSKPAWGKKGFFYFRVLVHHLEKPLQELKAGAWRKNHRGVGYSCTHV